MCHTAQQQNQNTATDQRNYEDLHCIHQKINFTANPKIRETATRGDPAFVIASHDSGATIQCCW
jgi:hypothetical protein